MKRNIPLKLIDPNPDQPRKRFDPVALGELADSILAIGLQSSPLVRPRRRRFEIAFGERRVRAHELLVQRGHDRFATIACDVRAMSDDERDIAAIVENLHRADVTVLEESDAFARLAAKGLTDADIVKQTGAPLLRVRWRLSLQKLAPGIRKLFASDQVDRQQAMELSRLPEHRDQHRVLKLINTGKLVGWKSVRNAVEAILEGASQADIFGDAAPKPSKADVRVVDSMEARIVAVLEMVNRGWRDGECVIAAKVDMNRAGLMADKLAQTRRALHVMERELRNVTAQGRIVLPEQSDAS